MNCRASSIGSVTTTRPKGRTARCIVAHRCCLQRPAEGLPTGIGFVVAAHYRVRQDKIDKSGIITLRHSSRLHHIGLGRALAGTRVLVLGADLDVRVLTEDGELQRELTLDRSRDYQP